MNNEIDLADNLLAELKEAYRSLPRHMQVRIASLLRESAPQQQLTLSSPVNVAPSRITP